MMKSCNYLDLFGTQILLRFRGKQYYKTTQGTYITFIIWIIIFIRLAYIIANVYQRNTPTVIFKERQVNSPTLFKMDKYNITFAFGMEDPVTFQQYIDPKIYNITMKQFTKQQVLNTTTLKLDPQWKSREVKIQRCQPENFQNQDTRDYFLSLNYKSMYCIDQMEHVEIEGDFNEDAFSYFTIKVMKCQGDHCASHEEISKMLQKGFFSFYYTDVIVDPVKKDNPFKYYARDIYWMTSTELPRDNIVYYRNTYVESDFGWIQEDIHTQHHGQFNSYENQYLPSSFDQYFFQLTFRFEKQKENLYQRKYKSITQIISEIGGFAQVLIAIGYLFCTRISQLSLSKAIINDAYNFRTQNNQSNQEMKEQIKKNNFKQQIQGDLITQSKEISKQEATDNITSGRDKLVQTSIQIQQQQNAQQLQVSEQNTNWQEHQKQDNEINKQNNNTFNNENLNSPQKQDIYSDAKIMLNEKQEVCSQIKKVSFDHNDFLQDINNIQVSPKEYNVQSLNQITKASTMTKSILKMKSNKSKQSIMSQILLSQIIQNKKTTQSESISEPLNQISDVNNKKIEKNQIQMTDNKFKKLFQSTTNSMKLSVFEYIKYFFWPFGQVKRKKQIIDYSLERLYCHLDVLNVIKKLLEVDKLKKLFMDSDQIKLFECIQKPTISDEDVFNTDLNEKDNEYSISYQDQRTQIQKLQDAYKAYQNVNSRGNKSYIDKKIINLIDPNIVDLFNFNLEENKNQLKKDNNTDVNKISENYKQLQNITKQIDETIDYVSYQRNKIQLNKNHPNNHEEINAIAQEEVIIENSMMSDIHIPNECLEQQYNHNTKNINTLIQKKKCS